MGRLSSLALGALAVVGVGYAARQMKSGEGLQEIGTGVYSLGTGITEVVKAPFSGIGTGFTDIGGGLNSLADAVRNILSLIPGQKRPEDRETNPSIGARSLLPNRTEDRAVLY